MSRPIDIANALLTARALERKAREREQGRHHGPVLEDEGWTAPPTERQAAAPRAERFRALRARIAEAQTRRAMAGRSGITGDPAVQDLGTGEPQSLEGPG